jgi:hypothetical protein
MYGIIRYPAALSTTLELFVVGNRTHEAVRKLLNSSVSAAPLPNWKPGKLGLVAIRTRRALTLTPVALFPFLCVAMSTGIQEYSMRNWQWFGLIFIESRSGSRILVYLGLAFLAYLGPDWVLDGKYLIFS